MGQQALIIVALSSLLVGMSVLGFMGAWDYSNDATATLFEREQALNIARSGVNLAISKLRHQKSWRTGYTNLSVSGGTVSVRVIDLGADTVRITAAGTINGVIHNAVLEAKLSSIFPTVESALTIFGDSVELTSNGKAFLIDGTDYNVDGSIGTNPAVNGVGVQSAQSALDVKAQLAAASITDLVKGKGGTPSIGAFSSANLAQLHQFYKERATIKLPAGSYGSNTVFGSLDRPEIVYVPGDLTWTGTISGTGILVVDGALTMKGKVEWKGIVLAMSGDVMIDIGGTGTPSILGTVWVGNTDPTEVTKAHVNGNPTIRYSYTTLMTILGNLGLLNVEVLKYYE
ncbi:MAG: hypothetical protein WC824_10185 [Bacteroidota bacterium]|jgi:hypothetical protein